MAIVIGDNSMGYAFFAGAPVAVSQPLADVANPGCGDPVYTARADQLVKEHIRNRSDQSQVFALLTHHLMACCEGNELLQRQSQRDRRLIGYILLDSLGHRSEFAHLAVSPSTTTTSSNTLPRRHESSW